MTFLSGSEGRAALPFNNFLKHTADNFITVEKMFRMGNFDPQLAPPAASFLLTNVHQRAPGLYEQLKEVADRPELQIMIDFSLAAYANMRAVFKIEELTEEQFQSFYAPRGIQFLPKPGTKKLLVIFTTMFNNFYWSNAATAALFKDLDCGLLFLKDDSLAMHMLGVEGFADSMLETGPAISRFAEEHGFEDIYITAFSSSTYAALYVSTTVDCRGYLGLSVNSDQSREPLNEFGQKAYRQMAQKMDPSLLLDLRPILRDADQSVRRTIYYSVNFQQDVVQAERIADLDTIEAIGLTYGSHNLPLYLAAENAYLPLFEKLLTD